MCCRKIRRKIYNSSRWIVDRYFYSSSSTSKLESIMYWKFGWRLVDGNLSIQAEYCVLYRNSLNRWIPFQISFLGLYWQLYLREWNTYFVLLEMERSFISLWITLVGVHKYVKSRLGSDITYIRTFITRSIIFSRVLM